jgi:hypothetical protein
MTKEEKKDRRQARHEVQAALKQIVLKKMGLYSTGPQIRQALKESTDRYYAEAIRPAAREMA